MQQSSVTTRRNYIPSPLGTPKRMAQKLGNQLSNCSPMLSRRAWQRVEIGGGGGSASSSATTPSGSSRNHPVQLSHQQGSHLGSQQGPPPHLGSHQGSLQVAPSNSSSTTSSASKSSTSSGFFSFLTSAMPMLSKRQINKNHQKNLFLNPKLHTDFEDTLELHQFSDSGRIANRYDSMRWDAWWVKRWVYFEYSIFEIA